MVSEKLHSGVRVLSHLVYVEVSLSNQDLSVVCSCHWPLKAADQFTRNFQCCGKVNLYRMQIETDTAN